MTIDMADTLQQANSERLYIEEGHVVSSSKTHSLSVHALVSAFVWVLIAQTQIQMTTNIV